MNQEEEEKKEIKCIAKTILNIFCIIVSLSKTTLNFIYYQVNPNFITPYFNELMTNWDMSPIKSFELLNDNEEIKKKENSIFYIPKKQSDKNYYIVNWNTNRLKINRNDKYNYVNFLTEILYQNGTGKKCGVDSKDNDLYFPKNEDCPINYISITDNSIDENSNSFHINTISLNNGKYLHFSNENTNGKIYIQTTIKGEKKQCENKLNDENYKNDICLFLDNCFTKNEFINIEDSYLEDQYKKIDKINLGNFIQDNNLNSLKNQFYKNIDEVYFNIREWIGVNISKGYNFSDFNTTDLILYFNSPTYFTSKIPNLCLTIVNFLCQGISFLLGFKKFEGKYSNCLSVFFLHFLSVICLIIDLCMWYLDFNKVHIFSRLKKEIYPSIDDRYPIITDNEDTYSLIYFWLSLYSIICIFIQFILKAFEKKCCCNCCKNMNSEKFEKCIKASYIIVDIMIVILTITLLMICIM